MSARKSMFKRLFSRSRMTRECPVRFYEGPRGLTKGSTHQKLYLSLALLFLVQGQTMLLNAADTSCCSGDAACSSELSYNYNYARNTLNHSAIWSQEYAWNSIGGSSCCSKLPKEQQAQCMSGMG